jgi:hypothetical protein
MSERMCLTNMEEPQEKVKRKQGGDVMCRHGDLSKGLA